MKYRVQIYCAIPNVVQLTPQFIQELKSAKLIAGSGFKKIEFDDEAALYYYVRGFDYSNKHGVSGNHLLEALMTNPNDSRRHRQYFWKSANDFYFLGYLVKDEKGRTIDLRCYKKDLYAFDYVAYHRMLRAKNELKWIEKRAVWDAAWEKNNRLKEGKWYWCSLRGFQTIQERRFNCDSEHKPFVRGKRRKLPEPWGTEIPIRREKTWKARTKVKKQWQVHLPAHIDTVWHNKRNYGGIKMVRVEDIRKAITELPVEELRVYLEETIWEGIEEDSPEEIELDKIRDEAMGPFLSGYDNLETRPMYNKLVEIAGCK